MERSGIYAVGEQHSVPWFGRNFFQAGTKYYSSVELQKLMGDILPPQLHKWKCWLPLFFRRLSMSVSHYNFEIGGINVKIIAGMRIASRKKKIFLKIKKGPAAARLLFFFLRLLKYRRTMIKIGEKTKDQYSFFCKYVVPDIVKLSISSKQTSILRDCHYVKTQGYTRKQNGSEDLTIMIFGC